MKTAVLPLKPLFRASVLHIACFGSAVEGTAAAFTILFDPICLKTTLSKRFLTQQKKKHSADASTVDIKLYQIFTQILIAPEHSPSIGETLPGFRAEVLVTSPG